MHVIAELTAINSGLTAERWGMRPFIVASVFAAACGGVRVENGRPVEPMPKVVWKRAPAVVLPFESYATASEDGSLIALAVDDEVVLVRVGMHAGTIKRMPGKLAPASTPLVAKPDGAAGVVAMRDVVRGLDYRVPSAVGGIRWNERTMWRAAAAGLVRAVTSKTIQAGRLHGYAPGDITPRWHVELRAGIADAVIAGDRIIVQLTDARGHAELAAYGVRDGRLAWRVATSATRSDQGALALGDGDVVTVLANRACSACEKVELHDVATGALMRTVALDGPRILHSAGDRGIRSELGIAGGELWFRLHLLHHDSHDFPQFPARPPTCAYEVFNLRSGKSRHAAGDWASKLTACERPVLLAPITGGLVAIAHDDAKLDVTRLTRAP